MLVRDAGTAELNREALIRKLAAWSRNRGHGSLVVSVRTGEARWWPYGATELGHDLLVLRVGPGAREESPGDLVALCAAAVDAEIERFTHRLRLRGKLGWATTDAG